MTSIKHLTDFSDKLNPMLVKELRQGLRGVGFVILFITLQAFLAFILLTTAAGASYQNSGHLLSRIIFFFFSFAVLIVQPLRGITALSSEIKGNTIDLLCLTRLSAWRITFGKWVSLMSQSALILTAIIPYLILRYFFGDMHIFSELLLLFTLYVISGLFTGVTIGLSAMPSAFLRVLIPIGAAFFVFIMISTSFASGKFTYQKVIDSVTLGTMKEAFTYLGLLLSSLYGTWIFLDLGTSVIAPISENRATFKRVVSFALIALALLVFVFADMEPALTLAISVILAIPICSISLTENPSLTPPITARFLQSGRVGKIAGRFLYPGWATGLLYVSLLYLLLHIPLWLQADHWVTGEHIGLITINTVFATMLMALVLTRIIARKSANRMGFFILFLLIQAITLGVITTIESISHNLHVFEIFFWLPVSVIWLQDGNRLAPEEILVLSYLNLIVYFVIALICSRPIWKHIREVEQQTEQTTTPTA